MSGARTLLVLAAVLAPMTAGAEVPGCSPAPGLEAVLGPGRALLLGEIHGTNEAPEYVATVACHALADDLAVTIALELPWSEEPVVRDFVASSGGEAEASLILDLPFWSKPYQDGRTSQAMLALLEVARAWSQSGVEVEVILLDEPADFARRDEWMARRLLAAVANSPKSFFIALTGNLHNQTAARSGRMGERVSGALGKERVVSLKMNHAGGSAWICEATQGCGSLELGDREAEPKGRVTLFPTPDSRGYDGFFAVGTLSASPPARDLDSRPSVE